MRIQNNIMAMNTHRMYSVNNSAVSKSAEKLSSGYRINRAGDDAAGLAISEKMRAQIRGLNMASKNSQDAVSLVQTAEGALQEVHSMLQRMNELAVQSASGTNDTGVDRAALQQEFQNLQDEIDQIAETTTFNDMKIMDGTYGKGAGQVENNPPAASIPMLAADGNSGATAAKIETKVAFGGALAEDDTFDITIGQETYTATRGAETDSWTVAKSDQSAASWNITVKDDGSITATAATLGVMESTPLLEVGNAQGSTIGSVKVSADLDVTADSLTVTDGTDSVKAKVEFNITAADLAAAEDGDTFTVTIGDDSVSFAKSGTAWTASADVAGTGDLNGFKATYADGKVTLEAAAVGVDDLPEAASLTPAVKLSSATAPASSFQNGTAAPVEGPDDPQDPQEPQEPQAQQATATIRADALADFGDAGDKVTIAGTTFTVGDTYNDTDGVEQTIDDVDSLIEAINADTDLGWTAAKGADGSVVVTAVNSDATTTNPVSAITSGGEVQQIAEATEFQAYQDAADGNGLVIQTGAEEGQTLTIYIEAMNTAGLKLEKANVDISTQDSASKAITATREAINAVSTQRAELGAMQNRLEHKISNLDNTAENLSAAESRIRDVDMAKEMTEFTKQNILSQAATAMLAQANAAPQGVLSLLQ